MEHFKTVNDNKAFSLGHCWTLLKDTKKWETSYALWRETNNKKRGKASASTGDVVDLDDNNDEDFITSASDGTVGHARRPGGHKADLARQAGSLALQETLNKIL